MPAAVPLAQTSLVERLCLSWISNRWTMQLAAQTTQWQMTTQPVFGKRWACFGGPHGADRFPKGTSRVALPCHFLSFLNRQNLQFHVQPVAAAFALDDAQVGDEMIVHR